MNLSFNKLKKDKTSLILIFIFIFSLIVIGFSIIYTLFNRNKNTDNLYNVGNLYEINNNISGSGVAIFDEFVIENFDNLEIKLDNKKVYRADSIVDNTNNFDAYEKATKIYNIIKDNKISEKLNDYQFFEKIKCNIIDNNFNFLDISSVKNLNNSSNYEKLINYLDGYLKNKSLKLDSSGYIVNFYDGFETLYNIDDFDKSNLELLTTKSPNKATKIQGLKYVNNKYFYFMTYIKDAEKYSKNKLQTNTLKIDKKYYNATIEKSIPYKNGLIVLYKLFDNIEGFINNRFIDYEISLNNISAYKVPYNSVFNLNGVDGVYFIKNNKVKFTPVKVIKKEDDFVYISNNFKEIFPDVTEPIYKDFEELNPFSKIILNPKDYKENEDYK
ncbi:MULTISPECIES: HlyD family efflux transporter periplasmic adaptor subunit [Helcococcus]|uniref:HlyD family efflux transporter periplasmic adaptor subunit n=3 Tax=Helcococcus bovis TaxID=3153252 RepID=A0ABW9F643_9FIRM